MESTTFASFGVVPDIGDFDFDLGSLDSFNDMDIDMESFNLIPDTNCSDPFGSLSFEQSLNLVDLKNVNTDMYSESNNSCFLDDFDVKETIKQDCMWSSFQDASRTNRPVNIRNRKYRGSHPESVTTVSLTPPSSYINDHLRSFDTPLPSDDDSSCSCSEEHLDVISPATTISLPTPCTDCSRVMADSSSSDHCYTSTSAPAPWSNKTSASAPLTPPESSEDEDSSSQGGGCMKPVPPLGGPRNLGLTEIENDRFNKVVKSILLKKSTINKNSSTQCVVAGPKFTFSLTTKNKNSLLMKKPRQLKRVGRPRKNGAGSFQSSSIKENKQHQQRLQRQQQQQQQQQQVTEQQQHYKQKGRRRQDKEDVKRSESRRNGGQKSDHKEARDVHNQMERQRRTDLKNAFDTLKDCVPTIANSDRASKQMVLDKAIDYCKVLKSKEISVKEIRKSWVQRNEALRKKLALIESQMTTCQLENAHWDIEGW